MVRKKTILVKLAQQRQKSFVQTKGQFLGYTFYKNGQGWNCKPTDDRKKRLYSKINKYLKRKHAVSRPLAVTFTKVNQIVKGWINYFKIGSIKLFIDKFGKWLRHKIRCIIIKQWKKPRTIYKNLMRLNIVCSVN